MAALRAARVKQEIVKVPQDEVVVTLADAEAGVVRGGDLEKDLAIHQQGEKRGAGKALLLAQLAEFLRCRQHCYRGGDLWIADPEQHAGTRRFQHHLAAASAHVSKTRQYENIGIAELVNTRPIIGELRFDDDEVVVAPRATQAVFEETVPRQAMDQEIDLFVNAATA